MDRAKFQSVCRGIGVELSDSMIDQFVAFEDALYEFNEVKNLTRVPKEIAWARHFVDSLLVATLIPEGATVLDLGCGPGFPSWPLACARPDLTVVGLDSNAKMLSFLESQPLPNLKIQLARAEEWNRPGEFDVVTGRALAPIAIQLEISARFAATGGAVIPLRTDYDDWIESKLSVLGLKTEAVKEFSVDAIEGLRILPIFRKIGRTDGKYPRRWAEIKKKPLF